MPKSLTKKYIRMVAQDDAAALLQSLGSGADPRDFHINGDLLPLRCAVYGAKQCFLALLSSRPDLAEEIATLADGNQERCIDWMGAHATPSDIADMERLAPLACSSGSHVGHSPLTFALAHGLWDSAQAWLALDPKSALLKASGGRGAFYLLAEPAYEIRGDEKLSSAWTEPPQLLMNSLISHGADTKTRSDKKQSALARAVASGSHRVFNTILSSLDSHDFPAMLARAELAFNPLHEAVWHDQPDMLLAMAQRGGDLTELTEKQFGLMHLAIRQNSKKCAQTLIDLGVAPDANPDASSSCACSAISSSDPAGWIDWLRKQRIDMDARDAHGSHWLELAWERLGFEEARDFWDAEESKPLRGSKSLLGPLERATRSKIDATTKVSHLLAAGIMPARLDLSLAENNATPLSASAFLDSLGSHHISGTSFGVYKHLELGAMWMTPPESTQSAPVAKKNASFDALEDVDGGASAFLSYRTKDDNRPRPSLLAYAASLSQTEVLQTLIAWGEGRSFWSHADHLCAWREALRVDANLSTLRLISKKLAELSIPAWGACEKLLAMRHLGPAKAKELGAGLVNVGEALSSQLKKNPNNLGTVFLLKAELLSAHASHFSSGAPSPDDVDLHPWRVAIASEHVGATKALLPLDCPMPAMSCLHVALSAAREKKPELALWASMRCKYFAAVAAPDSPWGNNPQKALSLWDDQMRYELDLALSEHPSATPPDILALPEGAASSVLLSSLATSMHLTQARKLVEMGIKAPLNFTRIAQAIMACARSATAMGKGNEELEPLRSFCDALCSRDDFKAILNKTEDISLLAHLPDPALFETFHKAGASAGGGTSNAFVELCKMYAGRLSPAFAGHLAELSRANDPTSPMAVASALAAMKSHNSKNSLNLKPTTASRLRLERAIRGVSPEGWFTSYDHGFCPVEAAIQAGNIALGLDVAELAPQGYCAQAGSQWAALWIKSRAPLIAKALDALDASGSSDGHALAAPALEAMAGEILRLAHLGCPLTTASSGDMVLASEGFTTHQRSKSRSLSWLLDHGWRPQSLVPCEELSYTLRRSLSRIFGGDSGGFPASIPLLGLVISEESHAPEAVELCLQWSLLGLPFTLAAPSGKNVSCHLLLDEAHASAYETRIIQSELGEPSAASGPATRRRL
jgi:hypothetical protein